MQLSFRPTNNNHKLIHYPIFVLLCEYVSLRRLYFILFIPLLISKYNTQQLSIREFLLDVIFRPILTILNEMPLPLDFANPFIRINTSLSHDLLLFRAQIDFHELIRRTLLSAVINNIEEINPSLMLHIQFTDWVNDVR